MDAHFVRPKISQKKGTSDVTRFFKIIRTFVPVFLLAAILPLMIGLVVAPPQISLFTNADVTPVLRVWVEPANVIIDSGGKATFNLLAEFDSDNKLIPEIKVPLIVSGGIKTSTNQITYSIPFKGKVTLGSFEVLGQSPGEASVNILKEGVKITAYDGPIDIKTAAANIVVR